MSAEVTVNSGSSTPALEPTTKTASKKDSKTGEEKKKKRVKRKSNKNSRKPTLKTKVIVRRLPPNLPEDIFMKSVSPWINENTVDYSIYIPGKLTRSKAKESVFSRAYFHLKSMEAVIAFHQGFDGHIFIDSKGVESRAVVEFAPYQKVPKELKSVDARQGTIDEDPDYLAFLESLKAEEEAKNEIQNEPADGLSQIERLENRIAMVTAKTLAAEQANKPKTTPLLEHLRAQKAAQAAAKAKAAARKNERRKAERAAKKNDKDTSSQQSEASSDGKRRRNRKKKEDESAEKKPVNEGEVTIPASEDAKGWPPRQPRPPREKRPPKEGAKPKRPNNYKKKQDDNKQQQQQRAPVKILGRQTPATTS